MTAAALAIVDESTIDDTMTEHLGDRRVAWDYTPHAYTTSSHQPGKERWSEANLYIYTDPDTYVLEVIGQSVVPGENILTSAHVYHDAIELVRTHRRGGALPRFIYAALQEASDDGHAGITSALHDYNAYRSFR